MVVCGLCAPNQFPIVLLYAVSVLACIVPFPPLYLQCIITAPYRAQWPGTCDKLRTQHAMRGGLCVCVCGSMRRCIERRGNNPRSPPSSCPDHQPPGHLAARRSGQLLPAHPCHLLPRHASPDQRLLDEGGPDPIARHRPQTHPP